MPITGRKPVTLEARRNNGEASTTLPVIVGGRPSLSEIERAPAGLDRWARQAWGEVAPLLVKAGLIDRADRQQLESYCMQVGRARALREAIEWEHDSAGKRLRRKTVDEQFITRTQRGYTSNPLLSQEREAWKEARMLAEGLGLNPVGRTRLVGKGPKRAGLGGLTASLPRPTLVQPPE